MTGAAAFAQSAAPPASEASAAHVPPTVAEVNGKPIDLRDVVLEFAMPHTGAGTQPQATREAALQRLIDQQLLAQRAKAQGLDQDPVVQAAVRATVDRELAQAYLSKQMMDQQPTAEDISRYYREHRALFLERKVYTLRELSLPLSPDQFDAMRKRLSSAATFDAFVASLRKEGRTFKLDPIVRSAEQLPLQLVDQFAAMAKGATYVTHSTDALKILWIENFKVEPVSEEKASAAIRSFLFNERLRNLREAELATLRKDADIRILADVNRL
jgi:EpsD family peptidyl-prolyl cis-trans isomerase